ncbi:MAG: hypothetical protein WBA28_02675 [Microbacteriaceae bacterium]
MIHHQYDSDESSGVIPPVWYGEAIRSLAPQPIIQVFFMLVYALWWVFAWPVWGSAAFGLAVLFAGYVLVRSVRNIRHAREFENIPTIAGAKIGKSMAILSGVSYGALWAAAITLMLFGQWRWILPIVTVIIALHFFPLARIFHRKIDYFLAPIALLFALLGVWMASNPEVSWQFVNAITGIGGSVATGAYSAYMLYGYHVLRYETLNELERSTMSA